MSKQQSHQMTIPGAGEGFQFQNHWGPEPGLSFSEIRRIVALNKPVERKIAIAQRLQRMRREKWHRDHSGPERPRRLGRPLVPSDLKDCRATEEMKLGYTIFSRKDSDSESHSISQ